MTPTAFYEPEGTHATTQGEYEVFTATEATGSPWGPNMQHGSPVAALLTRALSRHEPRPGHRFSRISVDLLGPVPLGQLRTSTQTVRRSRNTELVTATMAVHTGEDTWKDVAQAHGWRLATQPTEDILTIVDTPEPFTPPQTLPTGPPDFGRDWTPSGFVSTTNWHITHRAKDPREPSVGWLHVPITLVAGEPMSALERAMAAADVANGVGAHIDPFEFAFLNTELTVHLHHEPAGEWFGVAAATTFGPDGIGMSQAILHAVTGPIGRVAQTVLVQRR